MRVVFDVGANVGRFATAARNDLPSAQIYCFEPHPRTFEKLMKSTSDNLIFKHCVALSDKIGEVSFYEYGVEGDGTQLNSLIPNAPSTRFGYKANKINVQSSTVDRFCEVHGIDQIDFLKIDVEGAELSVLKGSKDMLTQKRIIAVYCEFNDLEAIPGSGGGALMPIAHYLCEYGFRYACTYTDFLLHRNELAVVANALFVLPPQSKNI